ncbi:MAG TPA: GtrA family protein [Dehalococcoidia bacterium]|jgi:putative flippase GtrA
MTDLRRWLSGDLAKFLVVGGVSFVVNQIALVALYEHVLASMSRDVDTPLGSLNVALLCASAIAVEISIIARFVLNDSWTFRSRRQAPLPQRFVRSNLSSLGSPVISLLAVNVLTPAFGMNYLVANSIGVLLGLAWNWGWSSLVVWPREQEAATAPSAAAIPSDG